MQPFDTKFNVAVLRMAEIVCPAGYDIDITGEIAPTSLPALNDYIARYHRIRVDARHSEGTIFADAEVNWAFRAWHDWTHYTIQAPFDLDGELAVAQRQIADLYRVFGHCRDADRFAKLIMCEVYGQARYYAEHGEFPADQRAFTRNWLNSEGGKLAAIWQSVL